MPKIIFEDKIDPITCSEVECNASMYYTTYEPQMTFFREGTLVTQYSINYIPRPVINYSI